MISAQWRASGVEGTSLSSVTTLRHLSENAVLHFRGGRLSRGAGYAAASKAARQSPARPGALPPLRPPTPHPLTHASAAPHRPPCGGPRATPARRNKQAPAAADAPTDAWSPTSAAPLDEAKPAVETVKPDSAVPKPAKEPAKDAKKK